MKYSHLKQIITNLNGFTNISSIYRVKDTVIKIDFDKNNKIYFEMNKNNSYIFKSDTISRTKTYNAPFDVVLSKKLNNSQIINIELLNNDKLLRFTISSDQKYKSLKTYLQFEFTGKHTNVILLDSDEIVIEALRHIDSSSSSRSVKVGEKLELPLSMPYIPKDYPLDDVDKFLYDSYKKDEEQKLNSLKKQRSAFILKKVKKLEKLLLSIENEDKLLENASIYQEYGNLLLSNLYNIKPYQKSITLYNYDGIEVEIQLDKLFSNVSNIPEHFFNKSKKAKQKAKNLYIQTESISSKLGFYKLFLKNIENTKTLSKLELLFPKKDKKTKIKLDDNVEVFYFEGFKILLGKNEKGNIYILENAKAKDIWFHLKDMPSAHVLIVTDKKNVPQKVLYEAAGLCVDFSLFENGLYLVDYTQRRNVTIQDGANVLYVEYKTVDIEKY